MLPTEAAIVMLLLSRLSAYDLEPGVACNAAESSMRRSSSVQRERGVEWPDFACDRAETVVVQRDGSGADTSTNFARENVKQDCLVVPCYTRDNATAVYLPAPRVVAWNSPLS